MDIFWQQITVFAAICLAVVYLVVYYIRRKHRKAGCANCLALRVLQDRQKNKTKRAP